MQIYSFSHSLRWKVFAVPRRRCKNCLDLIDWIVFYPWMVATIDENFNYIIYVCHRWREVEFISFKLDVNCFLFGASHFRLLPAAYLCMQLCANDSSTVGKESLAFTETNDQNSSLNPLKGAVTSVVSIYIAHRETFFGQCMQIWMWVLIESQCQ